MKNILLLFLVLLSFGIAKAQGTLQFNQVKLVSSVQTVPAGKVWKVVNIYAPQVIRFQASSGSGGCSGTCNGSSTTWNSFTTPLCPDQTTFNSSAQIKINGSSAFYNSNSPLWLPAGTTLEGNAFACNNSTGWFNGNGYSCFCPPSTTQNVVTNISVIEFNIIP